MIPIDSQADQSTSDEAHLSLNNITLDERNATDPAAQGSIPPTVQPTIAEIGTSVRCLMVNWKQPSSFPPEQADVIIGSDLVYDVSILNLLVPAVAAILKDGTGVCLCVERALFC